MIIFSIVSLINALILFFLANFVFYIDRKNTANRTFAVLCLLMGWWAFTEFMYRQAETQAVASLWEKALCVWPFMPAVLLHFCLAFTRKSGLLAKWPVPFAIYLPAIIAMLIELTTYRINLPPIKVYWGYTMQMNDRSWIAWVFYLWSFLLGFGSFVLCVRHARIAPGWHERKKAVYVSVSMLIPVTVIFISEFLLPLTGLEIPEMSSVSFAWLSILNAYAMWRYELFVIDPVKAAHHIVATMTDALFLADENGRIIDVNRSARELSGFPDAELARMTLDGLFTGVDGGVFPFDKAHVTEKATAREAVMRRGNGNSVPVNVSYSVLVDRNGRHVGGVCIARDVTEIRRREEEIRAVQASLERSNRELRDFASIASHDLQEPLRKIVWFSERLKTGLGPGLGERDRDYLGRMTNAATRMSELIDGLLLYSRVTTKAQPFERVDLSVVAREVLSDLEIRIQNTGGRVELGDLPAITADALQMRQLIQNLLSNALKYHREGVPPQVKMWAELSDGFCMLRVRDNGIGIGQEFIPRLFGPFQRLHAHNDRFDGTGIGLAICRKIVERHNGEISLESTVGEGSTFSVRLPVTQPSVA